MPTKTSFKTRWKGRRRQLRKLWCCIPRCFKLSAAVATIVLVWFAVPSLLARFSSEASPERGAYGDQYGAVNALFSGLALAGMAYAVILQSTELSEQRKDNKASRVALEGRVIQENKHAKEATSQALFDAWFSPMLEEARQETWKLVFQFGDDRFPSLRHLFEVSLSGDEARGIKTVPKDNHIQLAFKVQRDLANATLALYAYFERALALHRASALDGAPIQTKAIVLWVEVLIGLLIKAESREIDSTPESSDLEEIWILFMGDKPVPSTREDHPAA